MNPNEATHDTACQCFISGNLSLITVMALDAMAMFDPMLKTYNIKKNNTPKN
jgi:hypothetical protein